ncbi:MAG: T9SS type A sorting domain-containing protein [Bacteroidota bacterium]
MKRSIYLFFFFSTFALSAQQPFAPIGAKWYHSPQCYNGPGPHCEFFMFESTIDTLINGQSARKIEYSFNDGNVTELIPEASLVMYGDGDRVYYHFEDEFHVLYDFSAQAGDTFEIKVGAFVNYYRGSQLSFSDTGVFRVIVDSVSSVTINNENLRVLYLGNLPDFDFYLEWGFNVSGGNAVIIERIGNIGSSGLFGDSFTQLPSGFSPVFRCYEDPNIFYKNPDFNFPCDYLFTTSTQELSEATFEIFPNPAGDHFFIKNKSGVADDYELELMDVQGRQLLQHFLFIDNDERAEITTAHLENGIYFLRIKKEDDVLIKKIMVQK